MTYVKNIIRVCQKYHLLCEKSPNTEFFLVPVFSPSQSECGIQSDPSTGKYGPGKTPYLKTFQAVIFNSQNYRRSR